jgi:hypothetical protein
MKSVRERALAAEDQMQAERHAEAAQLVEAVEVGVAVQHDADARQAWGDPQDGGIGSSRQAEIIGGDTEPQDFVTIAPMRRGVALSLIAVAFVALAWPGASRRGLIAEEIQPYLRRYPHVIERHGAVRLEPPYETGAASRPRWVATAQWPVLAWDGESRMWPVMIRGHQSALATYAGIFLGPVLGGGVAGVRHSSVLLGVVLVLLTALAARRLGSSPIVAGAVLAGSFGTVWLSQTGYAFELGSRIFMIAAIFVALSGRRAVIVGLLAGLAIVSRATVAVTLLPALAILFYARRTPRKYSAIAFATALLLPLGLVAILPLAAGTTPLAQFPVEQLASRSAAIPQQLVLQLAWLADANSVLGPLFRGDGRLGLVWPWALAGTIPFGAALLRWWRGVAGDGERMFAVAVLANAILAAWLYASQHQFQLALPLEPLVALAVAEQICALSMSPRIVALILVAALRIQSLARGISSELAPGNPMASGKTQLAALARIQTLGARSDEIVTTTYGQAGVLEAWSDGTLTPLHAWPRLAVSHGHADPAALRDAWQKIIAAYHPRFVLLSDGTNLFDGPFTDNAAIRTALEAVAHPQLDSEFPTERGTRGWSLWRID